MNPNADFSTKEPFWRETWFYEQIAYLLVCLAPAAFASWQLLATKGPVTTRDTVLLVGTMLGQFLAQKARSVATRQSALLKCRGIFVPEVRCAPEMRGKWQRAFEADVMPTFHPAYLFRVSSARAAFEEDFRAVAERLTAST